jgi:hypothetical protein
VRLCRGIDDLGTLKKDIAKTERMLNALIKSLENKPLNPWLLECLDPLLQPNWRRTELTSYDGIDNVISSVSPSFVTTRN